MTPVRTAGAHRHQMSPYETFSIGIYTCKTTEGKMVREEESNRGYGIDQVGVRGLVDEKERNSMR